MSWRTKESRNESAKPLDIIGSRLDCLRISTLPVYVAAVLKVGHAARPLGLQYREIDRAGLPARVRPRGRTRNPFARAANAAYAVDQAHRVYLNRAAWELAQRCQRNLDYESREFC